MPRACSYAGARLDRSRDGGGSDVIIARKVCPRFQHRERDGDRCFGFDTPTAPNSSRLRPVEMDIQVLHQALQELPRAAVGPSESQVKKLAKLIDGDVPLQAFLEQLLPQLCDLFDAVAAVAWMKAHGASGAVFGVRYKMDDVVGTVTEQKQHERLVQIAWQQRQPMLAEPTSKSSKGRAGQGKVDPPGSDDNPTVHPLLFGPVLHLSEPMALLEIVLPEQGDELSSAERQLFLRGAKLVAERVYGGLRQRMSVPAATINQAADQIQQLASDIMSMQEQIKRNIEARLHQFQGWSFNSLAENQAFAKMVHQILDGHGLRVECPECGNPAILRCLRAGNAKHGAFVYDHYLDTGRTFHGGPTTVPPIKVVKKPARRVSPAASSS